MNNPVVIGVVLAYFVLMFAIGAWANTKMKSAKEFLVAGQSLGFFVMAIASFSSIQRQASSAVSMAPSMSSSCCFSVAIWARWRRSTAAWAPPWPARPTASPTEPCI